MNTCNPTTDAAAYGKRCDKAAAYAKAKAALVADFMVVATSDPAAHISTPAWADQVGGRRWAMLIDVLDDGLSGMGSNAAWVELVTALTKSDEGMAFLRKRAEIYAAEHASDEVEE